MMKLTPLICLSLLFTNAAFTQQSNIQKLIPSGFSLLDSATGDFNRDGFTDYIIILKNDLELAKTDTTRPLLIIHGDKNGVLKIVERNDKIVLCLGCGGVFGDPYSGISVEENYFSISHYSGSGWRWSKVVTFRFDKESGKYMLHKDAGESFNVNEPDKTESIENNKELWDKIFFEKYDSSL